jgi:NAD(P)-dependent dehydrogenase (short-subunit alcohol dehydrogenase family)
MGHAAIRLAHFLSIRPPGEHMTLKTRNAVVTGSASGIGLAIGHALAKEGANVMINGMGDAAAIEVERAGVAADFGVQAIYSDADLTKPDERLAERLAWRTGPDKNERDSGTDDGNSDVNALASHSHRKSPPDHLTPLVFPRAPRAG